MKEKNQKPTAVDVLFKAYINGTRTTLMQIQCGRTVPLK
jgi:hypothetical protein